MNRKRLNNRLKLFSLFLVAYSLLASACSLAAVNNDIKKQLMTIDKNHQNFSKDFYQQLLNNSAIKLSTFKSMALLETAVNNKKNQPILATALIIKNLPLLQYNYDNPITFSFLKILLNSNELFSAQALLKTIAREADDSLIMQANYLFAHFYFQRENWQQTISYLQGEITDLSQQEYHHALLIKGIALQKLTKHRQSLKYYKKIPQDSQYYIAATFNMALANIRQGWWTQGHALIKGLLEHTKKATNSANKQNNEATLNRLYITLGYSLLNQAYYRTAKEVFQQVGLHSKYTNQALLGLALTTANQNDYLGALNAIRILKEKKEDDLPVLESYLLMPFFYEKTQQLLTASAGYTQANSYFQNKISSLTTLINSPLALQKESVKLKQGAKITIDKTVVHLSLKYPAYVFENRAYSFNYRPWLLHLKNTQLTKKLNELINQYNQLTVKMAKNILQTKKDHLNSYLDQSRYGLARLYDNTMAE
jgi:hypothetical protein